MIKRLRSVRLTWPQIALIAATSTFATAVVIHTSTRHDRVPYATLSALERAVLVHRSAPPVSTSSAARTAPASPPPPADSVSSVPDATTAAATGTSTTAAGSGADEPAGSSAAESPPTTSTAPSSTPTPVVKHVFVIALSTVGYRAAFGRGSVARYLNDKLRPSGTLLSGYRTLGGGALADYLAMVSGQAPNADTRNDCPIYAEFPPSATARSNGQVQGRGCVYPNTALTVADQVTAAGKQWRAYLAGMGSSTCVHANSNAADDAPLTGADSDYATRHNPFIYFHSLLDLGGCGSDDMGIQHLAKDLRASGHAPTYAYIAPGRCDDPSETSCPGGKPGGLAAEDAFLKRWVPQVLASRAYREDGVLMIVFASGTPTRDPGAARRGPVRTGALVLSPLAHRGRTLSGDYDPYSVLRTVEDLLGYAPLVHAKGARSFLKAALPGA